jgi:hypothetical protein
LALHVAIAQMPPGGFWQVAEATFGGSGLQSLAVQHEVCEA